MFIFRGLNVVLVLMVIIILTGCSNSGGKGFEIDLDSVYERVFTMNVGNVEDNLMSTEPLFGDTARSGVNKEVDQAEDRFSHILEPYSGVVDRLWDSEEYYRYEEHSTDKEKLIDFYLFMEYHQDTQIRNLQFPENVQRDLLVIELLFVKKAIDYIESEDMGELGFLRDDLVHLYKNMYKEQLVNVLYEGKGSLVVMERVPGVIDRHKQQMKNSGLEDRLKVHLGIPDSVIARGIGFDMITLYDELGYLPDGDTRRLAIILSLEMRLSGISMRLERFFYVTNSLEGLGFELDEIKKDVNAVNPPEDLVWINDRMLRAIDHLEEIYLYYKGEREMESIEDIFIDVRTREDFYALGMLGESIKEVMDKEDYWQEVEKIRVLLREGRYDDLDNDFGEVEQELLEELEEEEFDIED